MSFIISKIQSYFPRFTFRHIYMGFFFVLVLLGNFLADPDVGFIQNMPYGAGFLATILDLTKVVVYATMWHVTRKGLFDYLDLEEYFVKAKETPLGASIALIAMALNNLAIVWLIYAVVIR